MQMIKANPSKLYISVSFNRNIDLIGNNIITLKKDKMKCFFEDFRFTYIQINTYQSRIFKSRLTIDGKRSQRWIYLQNFCSEQLDLFSYYDSNHLL